MTLFTESSLLSQGYYRKTMRKKPRKYILLSHGIAHESTTETISYLIWRENQRRQMNKDVNEIVGPTRHNKQLAKLQAPQLNQWRWKIGNFDGWMKKHYCENIKEYFLRSKMAAIRPELRHQFIIRDTEWVGDLSNKTHTTKIRQISRIWTCSQRSWFQNWFMTNTDRGQNRLAYTMMAMNDRRPGNQFCKCPRGCCIYSFTQSGKDSTIPRQLTKSESTDIFTVGTTQSTGHLVDLNTEFRCEYTKDNFENLKSWMKIKEKCLISWTIIWTHTFRFRFSYDKRRILGCMSTGSMH